MFLTELIYPHRCPVCMSVRFPGSALICAPCDEKLYRVSGPTCYMCGKPLADPLQEYCVSCKKRRTKFDGGAAYLLYSSKYTRRLIYEVKYKKDVSLLDYPCADFATREKEKILRWNADVLIPVPIHPHKLKARGFNQAEEIANRLSKVLNIPVDAHFLYRFQETEAQKQLSREDRIKNMQSAIRANFTRHHYKSVILVDDIFTTGATAAVCAEVLRVAGVQKVYICMLSTSRDF